MELRIAHYIYDACYCFMYRFNWVLDVESGKVVKIVCYRDKLMR